MYYKLLKILVTLLSLSEYTETTKTKSKPANMVPTHYLRFTSTAALLIGLQLFCSGVAGAAVSPTPLTVQADSPEASAILVAQSDDYIPPNNGGPSQSQGSGTR